MSLFSNKSGKLIVSGDSYADATRRENFGFQDVWGNNIANFLESDEIFHPSNLINTANSGAGNTEIFNKTLDELIFNKNIKLVIVMWSEFQRMDFEAFHKRPGAKYPDIGWRHLHPHRITRYEAVTLNPEAKNKLLKYNSIIASTLAVLRLFWITQNILKDIPHLMIQGCTPICTPHLGPLSVFGQPDDYYNIIVKECIRFMLKSSYVDLIEGKKFIGWPLWQQLGGFSIDDHLDKLDPEQEKYRVSEEDTHPNYAGHKIISELISIITVKLSNLLCLAKSKASQVEPS